MAVRLLLDERHILSENTFVEMVVWSVSSPLLGSKHVFKYRLALVIDRKCVLRYDNETGKGDHRHMGEIEEPYRFTSPEALIEDFWTDVEKRGY